MAPMHRPEQAAEELERAVGMGAVGLYTAPAGIGDLELHGPEMDVVWLMDISDRFSVRVIAAVMGLRWENDERIQHCKQLLDRKRRYIDVHRAVASEEVRQDALNAV